MSIYQINTVRDMINCTNDKNLDNFLLDLKVVIKKAHALQNLVDAVTRAEGLPELIESESKGFEWTDDGKHDISIELEKQKSTK